MLTVMSSHSSVLYTKPQEIYGSSSKFSKTSELVKTERQIQLCMVPLHEIYNDRNWFLLLYVTNWNLWAMLETDSASEPVSPAQCNIIKFTILQQFQQKHHQRPAWHRLYSQYMCESHENMSRSQKKKICIKETKPVGPSITFACNVGIYFFF